MFLDLVPKFLPITLLLLIGFTIKKTRFLSELSIQELKKFIVNISLPALLFFSFLKTDFEIKYIVIITVILFLNALMLGIGKAIQYLLKIDNPYFSLMFTGFEMGMLGFSLYGSVYGPESIGFIGVLDLGQEIFVWFILVSLLQSLRNGEIRAKSSLINFNKSPVIIAISFGIILNILGLGDRLNDHVVISGLIATLSRLSQVTIPFILIIIGYQLNFRFTKIRLPLLTVVLRLVLLIVAGTLINALVFGNVLHLDTRFTTALFTLLLLPPPFIIPLYMGDNDVDREEYVGNTLSIGTIFTIVGFFVMVLLFSFQ